MGWLLPGNKWTWGIVLLLVFWCHWSIGKINELADMKATLKDRDDKIIALNKSIETYTTTKADNAKWFDALNDAQVDLLCAARNTAPVVPDTSPVQVKEIIQYRDKITKCPTPDITKAEPMSVGQVMRPVNEEISLQALNNSWKAYCKAVGNMEDVCAPFR